MENIGKNRLHKNFTHSRDMGVCVFMDMHYYFWLWIFTKHSKKNQVTRNNNPIYLGNLVKCILVHLIINKIIDIYTGILYTQ